MTAYTITGAAVDVPVDIPTTLTLTADTNSVTGSKSLSVLKVDNYDLTTASALTISLDAEASTLDLNNATIIAAGSTVFVQVAPNGYTGPVYVRVNGGSGVWVQPVSIIG